MKNYAREYIENLSHDEFTKMVLHLGNYASKVAGDYSWRTGNKDELAKGETIETIVFLAIERAVLANNDDNTLRIKKGERRWDPQKKPDFKKYMMDVIDSLIWHLAKSKDNSIVDRVPVRGDESDEDWDTVLPKVTAKTRWMVRAVPTPDVMLERKQEAAVYKQKRDQAIEMLFEEAKDDPLVAKIIEKLLEGIEKPGEIAENIGIDVKEIYDAMKRLERKKKAVQRRLKNVT